MIVVTGSNGFIGSNLIRNLNSLGISDILAVDNHDNKDLEENIKNCQIKEYLGIEEFLKSIKKREIHSSEIKVIFHQGACSDTMEWDAEYLFQNNLLYSKELLEFCVEGSTPLIYASSASVYGSGNKFKEELKNESPINLYAYSKYLFDQIVRKHLASNQSQIVGLRYFNVFGRKQDPKGAYAAVIPKFVIQLMNHEAPVINGDGTNSRDFTYIDNVIRMNFLALTTKTESALNQIYNTAVGDRTTLIQLVHSLKKYLSKFDPAIANVKEIYGPNRLGDIPHSQASIDKAVKLLNYKPTHDFESGLKNAVDWYWESFKS